MQTVAQFLLSICGVVLFVLFMVALFCVVSYLGLDDTPRRNHID